MRRSIVPGTRLQPLPAHVRRHEDLLALRQLEERCEGQPELSYSLLGYSAGAQFIERMA